MNIPADYAQIVKETRKFATKELEPIALEMDLASGGENVLQLWKKSMELDLPGLLTSEEFGGAECEPMCAALVLEMLARYCAGFASVLAHHYVACAALNFGSTAQKKRYMKKLIDPGSEAAGIVGVVMGESWGENPLTLEKNGGSFRLNGGSPLTANAAYADLFCVFIPHEGKTSCVVVEKGAPGLTLGEDAEIPGLKANPFFPLRFENVKITPGMLLEKHGGAGPILESAMNLYYSFIAAMAAGLMVSARQKALAYAKERYQFGDAIINHQEIRRMLGDMEMRAGAGSAAWLRCFENGRPLGPGMGSAALAKVHCTDSAFKVAVDAVQIFGGYGYMHEQGVEKIMRDAKVLQVLGGSNPQLLVESV